MLQRSDGGVLLSLSTLSVVWYYKKDIMFRKLGLSSGESVAKHMLDSLR
jgi:hypothetical protein